MQIACRGADGFYCLEREPTDEDGEPSKEVLFRLRQEVVTPGDSIAHGLLPGGCISRTVRKQRQAVLQPLSQRLERKHTQARRGEFYSEWQPINAPANLGNVIQGIFATKGRGIRG